MFSTFYWFFSHLGLMAVTTSFVFGFRYDAQAPIENLYFNIVLYVVFILVHIVMTMPLFKRLVFGHSAKTAWESATCCRDTSPP